MRTHGSKFTVRPSGGIALALITAICVACSLSASAIDPTCTIREVKQRFGTQLVDITYDLSADQGAQVNITMQYSVNGGITWSNTTINITETGGPYKHITWNAGADWPNGYTANARVRLYSQVTQSTWSVILRDTDWAISLKQTSDGSYIVTGPRYTENWSVFLLKLDPSGQELWYHEISSGSGFSWALANSVIETMDGGYVVTGESAWTGLRMWGACLIKTGSDGIVQWRRFLGDGIGTRHYGGNAVRRTSDGGYVIVGYAVPDGPGWNFPESEVLMIKTDSTGQPVWTRTFGGDGYDEGFSVEQTSDGGFVLGANTSRSPTGPYLIKTDSDGHEVWRRVIVGRGGEYVGSWTSPTSDSGFVLTGSSGSGALLLARIDGIGNPIWTNTYQYGVVECWGWNVQQTSDGSFVTLGYARDASDDSSIALAKVDSSGNERWHRFFEGPCPANEPGADGLIQTTDGGFALVGTSVKYGTNYMRVGMVFKTDAEGFAPRPVLPAPRSAGSLQTSPSITLPPMFRALDGPRVPPHSVSLLDPSPGQGAKRVQSRVSTSAN